MQKGLKLNINIKLFDEKPRFKLFNILQNKRETVGGVKFSASSEK